MRVFQGIIFPNVIQALIDIKVIKSHADLLLKFENSNQPGTEITGDASRFRTMRKIEKMFNGNGKRIPVKESKKLIRYYITRFKEEFQSNKNIALSDYRYPGAFYLVVKSCFIQLNFSDEDQEKKNLADYVFNLCNEEKSLFKHYDTLNLKNIIEDKFNISFQDINTEILESYPDIKDDTINEIIPNIIKLHQYLHLFAIVEQYFYLTYGKQASQEDLLNRNAIKRLLPSVNIDGNYVSSISKLITHLFTNLQFSSQEKFIAHLCSDDIKCPERIKRKLNRWKSGDSQITAKAINELLRLSYKEELLDEIVIIGSLIDHISRALISNGLSVIWVTDEIAKYHYYQKQIIQNLGTPYLAR